MDAKTARLLTINSNEELLKELKRILEEIKYVAGEGKNKLCISPLTESVIVNHLVYDFGFFVETNNITAMLYITW